MFNSSMLDVAIGLVFVYLLFSFVATAMRESLESWLKSRGVLLEKGVLQLLTAPTNRPVAALGIAAATAVNTADLTSAETLLTQIYQSTSIFSLYQRQYYPPSSREREGWGKATKLPAYIPAKSFAEAVIEVVHGYANCGAGGSPGSIDRLRLALEGVPNAPLRNAVRSAIQLGGDDPAAVSRYLETWFTSVMDRVSGWYRRRTQWWVLSGSLLVAVAMNVNTITVVQRLSENGALRAAVANRAAKVATDQNTVASDQSVSNEISAVRGVGLPIGWGPEAVDPTIWYHRDKDDLQTYVSRLFVPVALAIPGWLMTALAISLGAPFWFDVLNKFMIVRTTIKPHEKSGEEGSKDPTSDGSGAKGGDASPPPPPPLPPPPSPDRLTDATSAEQAEIAALDPAERPREED